MEVSCVKTALWKFIFAESVFWKAVFVFLVFLFVFFLAHNNLCAQGAGTEALTGELKSYETAASIKGIWENNERFVEFLNLTEDGDFLKFDIRVVLKTYYKFFYDDVAAFTGSVNKSFEENKASFFYLNIKYPLVKKIAVVPVCAEGDYFFTSFYRRSHFNFTEKSGTNEIENKNVPPIGGQATSPLYGFWTEEGDRNGFLLYPYEAPESFDAYFFTDNDYIRFRYWRDDLAYNEKKVTIKSADGTSYEFPKLLKRRQAVYSCVTNNGSVLRNFETGTYTVSSGGEEEGHSGLTITLHKQGAGIGTHAAADTYPHAQFPVMQNIPLHILNAGDIFAFGEPFLKRSAITDLNKEISEHNAKRRKTAE